MEASPGPGPSLVRRWGGSVQRSEVGRGKKQQSPGGDNNLSQKFH